MKYTYRCTFYKLKISKNACTGAKVGCIYIRNKYLILFCTKNMKFMKNIYNILTIYLILQTLHCKIGFFEPSKYTPTLTIIYTVYMLHNTTKH